MIGAGDDAARILAFLEGDAAHVSSLFPVDTNETMTFTSHASNNVWSAWVEIADNNAVTLSSKAATKGMHISSLQTESTTVKDKVYIYEISYGSAKVLVVTGRLISGTNQVSTLHQTRMRGLEIPAGETIYYRLKCEAGTNSLTASLRYHTHD